MTRIKSSSVHLGESFVIGKAKEEDVVVEPDPDIIATIEEAQAKAELMIDSAQKEAEQILSQAKEQAQELLQISQQQGLDKGTKTGLEQGYNEGFKKILQEQADKIQAIEILSKSSFDVKKQIIKSAEKDIIELVIIIAEKLVKSALEIEPEFLENIIISAIQELKEKEEVRIIVNPLLADKIYGMADIIKNQVNNLQYIKIIEDKTVSSDGVIVESIDSRVDARLATQVSEITKALFSEYSKNPAINEVFIENPEIIEPSA